MNKVISVEIAGQVFWIDEQAFDVLQAYLQQIRMQLADDESGNDIFTDIELRIAELLFAHSGDEQKAISLEQLEDVIEQVGYIDGDDEEVEEVEIELPRKSYRDTQNKILGGVCAGLAIRLKVPAFLLRVVFILLTGLLGLGIALYLIFWISLDNNSTRNAALAAQGKARTARQIASVDEHSGFMDDRSVSGQTTQGSYLKPRNRIFGGVCAELAMRLRVPTLVLRIIFIVSAFIAIGIALYLMLWIFMDKTNSRNTVLAAKAARAAKENSAIVEPKEGFFLQLQRIIFLPLSILGALVTVIGSHFSTRRGGYFFIFKNIFAFALLIAALISFIFLYQLNEMSIYSWPIAWVISGAVIYLVVLILAIYFKEYYLTGNHSRVEKELKISAVFPVAVLVLAIANNINANSFHENELVEEIFNLENGVLNLEFNETRASDFTSELVRYEVRTNSSDDNVLKLLIDYSGSGYDSETALESAHAIDYLYTFNNNTLKLDKYWSLQEGALYREQRLKVIIEIPQHIRLSSDWPLTIIRSDRAYYYRARDTNAEGRSYLTDGEYIHEYGEGFMNRLSNNERRVLQDKFCEEFFISQSWSCSNNIRNNLRGNNRFDRAFQQDIELIGEVKTYLAPNRSLFINHLVEMKNILAGLSIDYPVMSDLQAYIEHLITIKSGPSSQGPG